MLPAVRTAMRELEPNLPRIRHRHARRARASRQSGSLVPDGAAGGVRRAWAVARVDWRLCDDRLMDGSTTAGARRAGGAWSAAAGADAARDAWHAVARRSRARAGVLIASGAGRALEASLFGVQPHDPATLAAAAATMLVASGVAAYVPARRALKVDPVQELTAE